MAGGAGTYFFTGNPEVELQAANIRAQRQLNALGQITEPVGQLLGTMREQRRASQDADVMNAKLGATLGTQEATAQGENHPTMDETTVGATSGSGTGSTGSPEPSALHQIANRITAAGTSLVGGGLTRLAQAGGSMLGLSDYYPSDLQAKRLQAARGMGEIGQAQLDEQALRSGAPLIERAFDPGTIAGGLVRSQRIKQALTGAKFAPPRGAEPNEWDMRMRAAKGDPDAQQAVRTHDAAMLGQINARNFPAFVEPKSPEQQGAFTQAMSEWLAANPGKSPQDAVRDPDFRSRVSDLVTSGAFISDPLMRSIWPMLQRNLGGQPSGATTGPEPVPNSQQPPSGAGGVFQRPGKPPISFTQ